MNPGSNVIDISESHLTCPWKREFVERNGVSYVSLRDPECTCQSGDCYAPEFGGLSGGAERELQKIIENLVS